jgi:hypothetical protein
MASGSGSRAEMQWGVRECAAGRPAAKRTRQPWRCHVLAALCVCLLRACACCMWHACCRWHPNTRAPLLRSNPTSPPPHTTHRVRACRATLTAAPAWLRRSRWCCAAARCSASQTGAGRPRPPPPEAGAGSARLSVCAGCWQRAIACAPAQPHTRGSRSLPRRRTRAECSDAVCAAHLLVWPAVGCPHVTRAASLRWASHKRAANADARQLGAGAALRQTETLMQRR